MDASMCRILRQCAEGDERAMRLFLCRQDPWTIACDRELCATGGFAPLRNPHFGKVRRVRNAYKKTKTFPPVAFFQRQCAFFEIRLADRLHHEGRFKDALLHYICAENLYRRLKDDGQRILVGFWMCHVRDQAYPPQTNLDDMWTETEHSEKRPEEWEYYFEDT